MGFSVGRSSYGDLRGVEQFVSTANIAAQVASLALEFDTQFPGARERGDRLTVNEGIRSRPRQKMLRDAWEHYQRAGYPWAALAAALYFSTHDESRGSALDFGITQADGTNRAMTRAEAEWVHVHGAARGVRWTGQFFNPQEQWHHNGGYPATLPPIPGAPLPGTVAAPPVEEEDDMTPDERKMLTEVHAYVKGLHNMVNDSERGVTARLAKVVATTDFIKGQFTASGWGVRDRLASILNTLKGDK
jgi:hypothetical protein